MKILKIKYSMQRDIAKKLGNVEAYIELPVQDKDYAEYLLGEKRTKLMRLSNCLAAMQGYRKCVGYTLNDKDLH